MPPKSRGLGQRPGHLRKERHVPALSPAIKSAESLSSRAPSSGTGTGHQS